MRLLNTLTLATLGLASLAEASSKTEQKAPVEKETLPVDFACPSEEDFLADWGSAVKGATSEDASTEASADRAIAYDYFYPANIPNHNLLHNVVTIAGVEYELTLTADDFYWNPEYPDAYGVIFRKDTGIAVATLKTDTDRSDYQCKALFTPTLVLAKNEFLSLTIDSPQNVPATIRDVRYETFNVVSQSLAFGQTADGDFVQFVPAKQ